ncbi:MAG: nuclear transport factor 2 family protein [Comamonadaceae bacterium]|nr:MAG: nuclear transport factor 2 family protein [Comamonadaceae bacterium]
MHPHQQTIEKFYGAFARLDHETMAGCYADDVEFEDEVFTLRGKREVAGMWRMLCEATKAKGADVWKLEFRDVQADATSGSAHWDAWYRFSATGRMVHNSIDAAFTFNPHGLITVHRDRFDFWRWSRQALGAPGLLLGWTPVIRGKVRATAAGNLEKFLASRPAAQ